MTWDIVATTIVIALLSMITVGVASRFSRDLRGWIFLGLVEYLLCSAAQFIYSRVIVRGGDELNYATFGGDLARLLDQNFGFVAKELLAMLVQRPSMLDPYVIGGGTSNTASMYAASAWLIFLFRGSEYAAQVFLSGLAFFGALGVFNAFRKSFTQVAPVRLLIATVLFPSTAFWTSALHKETFCLIGMGLLFSGWRAIQDRRFIAPLFYVPLGLWIMVLFRAPALPPIIMGIVVHFAWQRLLKVRGVAVVFVGPFYLALGLGVLALSMVAFSRIAPTLALDRLAETVAAKQRGWSLVRGGSSFDEGEDLPVPSLAAQLLRVPFALLNALFRPQFFDVNNIGAAISAMEMTVLVVLIFLAIKRNGGLAGTLGRIQSSPFLLMCLVTTIVGCTFVGLVTLNFGSLARYRVPFLPFYGSLVGILAERRRAEVRAPAPAALRGHRLRPPPPRRPVRAR